jgi:hypothetical protein
MRNACKILEGKLEKPGSRWVNEINWNLDVDDRIILTSM